MHQAVIKNNKFLCYYFICKYVICKYIPSDLWKPLNKTLSFYILLTFIFGSLMDGKYSNCILYYQKIFMFIWIWWNIQDKFSIHVCHSLLLGIHSFIKHNTEKTQCIMNFNVFSILDIYYPLF